MALSLGLYGRAGISRQTIVTRHVLVGGVRPGSYRHASLMALLRLSGVRTSGTHPRYSSMRMWEAIQSGSVCVQVASAYVYLLAPIEAMRSVPRGSRQ